MLLTRDSQFLFFGSGLAEDNQFPNQINKFSVNKKEVVAVSENPLFEKGIGSMALSPDSNSIYVATDNLLWQFSLKDGLVMQSRNVNERPDMKGATIYAMRVSKNNLYLVTGTIYIDSPEKGTERDLSVESVPVGGPVCVWSTKDLTLVKT